MSLGMVPRVGRCDHLTGTRVYSSWSDLVHQEYRREGDAGIHQGRWRMDRMDPSNQKYSGDVGKSTSSLGDHQPPVSSHGKSAFGIVVFKLDAILHRCNLSYQSYTTSIPVLTVRSHQDYTYIQRLRAILLPTESRTAWASAYGCNTQTPWHHSQKTSWPF